jgi:hypothetical protein
VITGIKTEITGIKTDVVDTIAERKRIDKALINRLPDNFSTLHLSHRVFGTQGEP